MEEKKIDISWILVNPTNHSINIQSLLYIFRFIANLSSVCCLGYDEKRCDSMTLTLGSWIGIPAVPFVTVFRADFEAAQLAGKLQRRGEILCFKSVNDLRGKLPQWTTFPDLRSWSPIYNVDISSWSWAIP